MGVVRGISYGLFGEPQEFGPAALALNAGLVRAYVYWGQVEPEPGRYDWTVVDRLLDEVAGGGRLWVTVCSSSAWATRTETAFLPASPPLDPAAYARFVSQLVRRCAAYVDYWQCENEPSNAGLLWSGTAGEYAELLEVFAGSVRAEPGAGHVVLGGIGYDVLSSEPDSDTWRFFERVCATAGASFDLVDVHLYDDPRRIPMHLAAVRALLERNGCDQPLVVGEYGGPTIFGFPDAEQTVQATMATVLSEGGVQAGEQRDDDSPDRRAMRELYRRLPELPGELQQFLDGCPPEVAARRDRIACRELVTRNLMAFAEGVAVTCYWQLAPEIPDYSDPLNPLGLISARLPLLDFEDGQLVDAQPAAATFRMLAAALQDAVAVQRITLGDRRDVRAFNVVFPPGSTKAVQVLWQDADPFAGDLDDLHEAFEWHWVHDDIYAANAMAFGVPMPAWTHGRLAVPLSATPILLSSTPLLTVG